MSTKQGVKYEVTRWWVWQSRTPHTTFTWFQPWCLTIPLLPADAIHFQVSCTLDWFPNSILGHTSKVSTTVLMANRVDSQNTAIGHVQHFKSVPPQAQFLSILFPVKCGLRISRGFACEADHELFSHTQISHLLGDLWCNYKIQWEIMDKFHFIQKTLIHTLSIRHACRNTDNSPTNILRCLNTPRLLSTFHHDTLLHTLVNCWSSESKHVTFTPTFSI